MAISRDKIILDIPGVRDGMRVPDNVLIPSLRKLTPIIRQEVRSEIQDTMLREVRKQEVGPSKQSPTRLSVDGVDVTDRDNKGLTRGEIKKATDFVNFRARAFFQFNKETLKEAVTEAWDIIQKRTLRASSPNQETISTFYLRGRTTDPRTRKRTYTGQMKTLPEAISWIDRTDNIYMGISIEGPQTPYRRKFIYLYAYRGRKRITTERLKNRGIYKGTGAPIFSERAEFSSGAVNGKLKVKLFSGRYRERYEVQGYKPYLKTIARGLKTRYAALGIGYGFVPMPKNEELKAYRSSTGMRPWGNNLPRIFIGLRPSSPSKV